MKSISPALEAHLKSTPTTVCVMWKIRRADGQLFTYTEHDKDVTYDDVVYKSTGGFNKTAMKSSGTFATDNMEVSGFLTDDTIPETELRNGAFDYAEVEIFLINYMDPSMGELKLRYGFFGEVRHAPSGAFLVELRGLIDLLSTRIGNVYTPECRVDLGSDQCKVEIIPPRRIPGAIYKTGDRVIVPVAGSIDYMEPVFIGPTNPSYETGSLSGWSGNFVSISQGDINIEPLDGSDYFARFRSFSSNHSSSWSNIEVGPITGAMIAAGTLKLRVQVYAAAIEAGNFVGVTVNFRTGSGGGGISAGSVSIDFGALTPLRKWQLLMKEVLIPSNARSVQITPWFTTLPYHMTDFGLDEWGLLVVSPNDEPNSLINYPIFGGVEFEALNDGQAEVTTPTFDDTIDAETVDGTITWKCVEPRHQFLDSLAVDSTDPTKITATTLSKVDGWFDWGVVRFWSGANAGRSVEVFNWNSTTKVLTLAMPLTEQALAGDLFTVHTGCDKRRTTCNTKFANILNFRGEPDVPGIGEYFRVAGLRP